MEADNVKHKVKIVAVGDEHAGKTGFVEAYLKDKEYEKRKYCQNDHYLCSAVIEGGQVAEIDLWNTAGNENDIYKTYAYPNTSVFLLCFSLISKTSLANIEAKWVPELRNEMGCKILVGCKKDPRDRLLKGIKKGYTFDTPIETEMGEEIAKRIGAFAYVECSAATGEGVDDVIREALRGNGLEYISLHQVAKSGELDLEKISELKSVGHSPNFFDVLFAFKNERSSFVNHLLKWDRNNEDQNVYLASTLLASSQVGEFEFVDLLLKHGADPNCSNKNGQTPLFMACNENHGKVVDVLLSGGANPKATDGKGWTPLMRAIKLGHAKAVDALMDYEFASGRKVGFLASNLIAATQQRQYGLVEKILEMVDGNLFEDVLSHCGRKHTSADISLNNDYKTFINHWYFVATDLGHFKVVSFLIHIGIQPNVTDGNGWTALMKAIKKGDTNVINVFLEQKRDSKDKGYILASSLIAATKQGQNGIVGSILEMVNEDEDVLYRVLHHQDKSYKTALEYSVLNQDVIGIILIIRQEHKCHKDREDGLNCLRKQLANDTLLKWTLDQFNDLYEKEEAEQKEQSQQQKSLWTGFLGIIPNIMTLLLLIFDLYSDIELGIQYYCRGFGCGQYQTNNATVKLTDVSNVGLKPTKNHTHLRNASVALSVTNYVLNNVSSPITNDLENSSTTHSMNVSCTDTELSVVDYKTAFYCNITFIICPIITIILMCSREIFDKLKAKSDRNTILLWCCAIILSIPSFPIFFIYITAKSMYYKFRHSRAMKKINLQQKLQKYEHIWGNIKTMEAGFESSGQLVLQVWILSASLHQIRDLGFWGSIQGGFNGILHFATFSKLSAENEVEKSLGKLLLTILSLVLSIAGCYKIQKRGAFSLGDMPLVYLSLLVQVVARIVSFALAFFAMDNFRTWFPIHILTHFSLVFLIKSVFGKTSHIKGAQTKIVDSLGWLTTILNTLVSSLVYVRITPYEKDLSVKSKKHQMGGNEMEMAPLNDSEGAIELKEDSQRHHTTFLEQVLFFLLVLLENLILAIYPFIKGGQNEALNCLGRNTICYGIVMVIVLNVLSWMFQVLHYKRMHPWQLINGPSVNDGRLKFNYYLCGEEKPGECKFLCWPSVPSIDG